jgi:hypothetical protein
VLVAFAVITSLRIDSVADGFAIVVQHETMTTVEDANHVIRPSLAQPHQQK